jgi:hypothetical protein
MGDSLIPEDPTGTVSGPFSDWDVDPPTVRADDEHAV